MCMRICVCVCLCLCVSVCLCVSMSVSVCMHVSVCVYAYVHMCTQTCVSGIARLHELAGHNLNTLTAIIECLTVLLEYITCKKPLYISYVTDMHRI